jgi:uncharacterized membrane protein
MESRAKLFGHPIHQMLIVFPLGLLATSLILDIVYLITDSGKWTQAAFYDMGIGILGGLLAALFGLIDWLAITAGTRAKSVGARHGLGNLVVVVLFIVNWLLRKGNPQHPGALPIILSFVAIALALMTAWLGGELVDRLRVGVDDGAHLDAPSSLSGRPAGEGGDGRHARRRLVSEERAMSRPVSEQVVVITGASSGIGRETALMFGERGATVVLAARNAEALDAVAREIARIGGRAYAIPTDVAEWEQMERLAQQAVEHCDRIDTWVNNAGNLTPSVTGDAFETTFETAKSRNPSQRVSGARQQ